MENIGVSRIEHIFITKERDRLAMVDEAYASPLAEAGVVALLMRLSDNGRVMQDDLKEIIPNFDTRKKRIAELIRSDLVIETVEACPKKTIYLELSEKGKRIARILSPIMNLSETDVHVKDRTLCMKYAVPVIRMINHRGRIKVTEILGQLPYYTPIKKYLLPAMNDNGIASVFKEDFGHKAEVVELTTIGKMMALGLDEVHKIINE